MKALLLIITSLLLFIACKPDETVVPAQPEQLVGEWRLVEPASPYGVTLKLSEDSTSTFPFSFRLSGESSANVYFGTFRYNNSGGLIDAQSQIGIFDFSATKRGSSPEAMQFEQTYFASLRAVNRYEQTSQNRLRLHYSGAQIGVLIYERVQ